MEVISLDLSLIDSEDTTFLVGHKENLSFLQSSIKEIGLLNPPILRVLGEKYQIISGWKRILSCKELGLTELLCKIYYSSDLSDIDCLKIVFYDNKDNFSDLELAELIKLFKDLCLIDDKALMDNILPLLEIPSTRKHLDKYLCLASLDQAIKDAYYRDKITIEQCQMLSEIVSDNQVPMLEYLLLKYNLNNNESRQVMQIVEEIALRDLKSIPEVVSQAEDAINTENKGKNELRQELRRMRYPDLSAVEAKYKRAVSELNLPKEVNLFINQFFEGNDLEFRIKVKSTDELSQALHSLEGSLSSGDIEKLLNILRKGIN
ncbi:MAG: ParB/RepB/Spo0J family partition protein [Candidatus Dadabacteria bacterium]|jgi:ParB-like chromosome segregation protein Spo0J